MNETTSPGPAQAFVCPCCGSAATAPAGSYAIALRTGEIDGARELSYPLRVCADCGHVAAFPRPSAEHVGAFYRSAAFWAGHAKKDDDAVRDWRTTLTAGSSLWERFRRARRQLDYIRARTDLPADAKIIDLGSGYSPFLYHCRQDGFTNLYALEPSDEVCGFLQNQGVETYAELLEDFIARTDLPAFDAMVISHTVEHLADPHPVLRGLREKLSPEGVLYIDVPYQDHLRPFHEGLHFHFFNETSMARLLERDEYGVVAIEHDEHGVMDRLLGAVLYRIYGRLYSGTGGVKGGKVEVLHRLGWRPLKALLGLKLNIFISSMDLRALAKR